MIPFNIPASSSIDPETGLLPPEGWYDATMTGREAKMSKSGKYPLMSVEFTVDNGRHLGTKLPFTFTFGLSSGDGEAALLKFLNADGTMGTPTERWQQLPTLEEFVNQFPANKLRAGIYLKHNYSIDTGNGWENGVLKNVFESHTGQKNIRAEIADFRGAANPSGLSGLAAPPAAPAQPATQQSAVNNYQPTDQPLPF